MLPFKSLQMIGFWISKAHITRSGLSWHEECQASPHKTFCLERGGYHFPGGGNAKILNSTEVSLQRNEEVKVPGKDWAYL